jgi:hypothetical protein
MKKQGNMIPQKVNNHITKDLNDSERHEISNFELKRIIVRIINKMKNMHRHLN